MSEHDYLYDKSGPPDRDVERLERLLAPLGHRGGTTPRPSQPQVPLRHTWRWRLVGAGLAAAAAAALVLVLVSRDGPPGAPPPGPSGPPLEVVGVGRRLAEQSWVETGTERTELTLGDVGHVTLDPGSRLQVRRLGEEETRLYLERGTLHALVSADARPRFFQVDTPSARCVDLGCRYTLAVDAVGDARVTVETGQVAFENEGREVYVPAGATCRATRAHGAGTPCFDDAPEALRAAVSAFDGAQTGTAEARRAQAEVLLAATASERDALAAWHLLQDPDEEIAVRACARLTAVAGDTPGCTVGATSRPNAAERQAWKERLAPSW